MMKNSDLGNNRNLDEDPETMKHMCCADNTKLTKPWTEEDFLQRLGEVGVGKGGHVSLGFFANNLPARDGRQSQYLTGQNKKETKHDP